MKTQKLYRMLAQKCAARKCCAESGLHGAEWKRKHEQAIEQIVKDFMPSGSGLDCGTKIDLDASDGETLVFYTEFHHMNENGFYDGWTTHRVKVQGSLVSEFDLHINGRDRNQIKDYLTDVYDCALREELDYDETEQRYFSPAQREAYAAQQQREKEQLK
jgi:hypothetical protein